KIRGVVDRNIEGKNIYSGTDALVERLGDIRDDRDADRQIARAEARKQTFREPACARPEGFEGPVQCLAYDLGEECLLAAHASREPLEGSEGIMHDKFFVVDRRWVWTGSTNISDSGTGGYNANLVTVVDSPLVAEHYETELEQMFVLGRYHGL